MNSKEVIQKTHAASGCQSQQTLTRQKHLPVQPKMFPRGLCLCPPPASSPWSLGDEGPRAQPLAELCDRPVLWSELGGAEFRPRNGRFGNVQEPACEIRQQCCFCPLSSKFVLRVLMELHVTYVALSYSLSSALQAMAVLVPRFPSGRHCQGWGHWRASLSLPSPPGPPPPWP